MPREKEAYRDNLERIMDRFPGKEVLTLQDVGAFTGMGYRAIKSSGIPFKAVGGKRPSYIISIASFARWLS